MSAEGVTVKTDENICTFPGVRWWTSVTSRVRSLHSLLLEMDGKTLSWVVMQSNIVPSRDFAKVKRQRRNQYFTLFNSLVHDKQDSRRYL